MNQTMRTVLLLVAMAVASSGYAETRTWTSATGATIDAELVAVAVDEVTLRKADGSEVRIALNKLSPSDQIWVQANRSSVMPRASAAPAAEASSEPTPISKLVGKKLTNAGKDNVPSSSVTAKRVGLYFSAHWCPPCRAFTPQLVKAYNQMKADGKSFEIIFVSRDRDAGAMTGYMKEANMPWLAVPYSGNTRDELCETFGIQGIPTLVILDENAKVVSENGRGEVTAKGAAAFDGW